MIPMVVLGVLAGSVTLVLASVVLAAGRERTDNRLYAGIGVLAAGSVLFSSVARLEPAAVGLVWDKVRGQSAAEGLMAGLILLFAVAFPDGQRPRRGWWVAALAVVAAGTWLSLAAPEWAGTPGAWMLAAPYVVAVGVLIRKAGRGGSNPQHRVGLLIVAAALAARWLLASGLALGGLGDAVGVGSAAVPHDLLMLAQALVIGGVILRCRMLDVRRAFRQAAWPLAAAVLLSAYVALLTAWGPWLLPGAGGAVVAVVLPPLFVCWAAWTWRGSLRAASSVLDPHRSERRELVERVLAVTGYVVDPEAVLAGIQAAILEVFPGARVDFWRVQRLRLLPGVSRIAPATLEEALRVAGPYADAARLVECQPELGQLFHPVGRRLLLPVRRDNVMYGAFELRLRDRVDADDLLRVAALADHFAVKLENLELSSSLGEAGRELAHVRGFLEDLIESLPVGIVGIAGPELRVRLWNPAEAKRTGVDASQVMGKRYLEEVAPTHIAPRIQDALRQGVTDVLSFRTAQWMSARQKESVDITLAPLRRRAGVAGGYVLILEDTAERDALQQEGQESRQLAALGQFAAAIAHDIRTPLSSIKMSVQILRSKADLPAQDMEYFDLTLEAISRLARKVDDLLDFTKPSLLCIQDTSVREMLEDVRAATMAGAGQARVSLEVDASHELCMPVDEVQLRKALVNLVDNALLASQPGATVKLEACRQGDKVCVSVKDTGCGIVQSDLERIWDPFFSTRPDGVGLGLAIVRKAVTAHGGSARVATALGCGTTVQLLLPATRSTEVVVPIDDYQSRAKERFASGDAAAAETTGRRPTPVRVVALSKP
jgi:signal transduction histidine kinase